MKLKVFCVNSATKNGLDKRFKTKLSKRLFYAGN
jgi:hypothetical protein